MKKKIFLINIAIILIILLGTASYAAVSIVPGTDVMVNISSTDAYLSCRNMKNTGESLYGTTVEPHLTTNADWGAVSYLSNSAYGTNTAGGNTGIIVNIDDVDYYSTNGNITGVMNWGANPQKTYMFTQTACLTKAHVDSGSTSSNVLELENVAKENSRFVEIIDTDSAFASTTKGMAFSESSLVCTAKRISGSKSLTGLRVGIFGYSIGGSESAYPYYNANGGAWSLITFRPVIWNK